ncbi:hypothetical protein ES703_94210 [subsurface metagenome]
MPNKTEADAAISGLKQLKGQVIIVNKALPRLPVAGMAGSSRIAN